MQDAEEMKLPLVGTYVNTLMPAMVRMTDGGVVHSSVDLDPVVSRYRLGMENLIYPFDRPTADEAAKVPLTVIEQTWENWTLPGELAAVMPTRISFLNPYVSHEELAGSLASADAVSLLSPYIGERTSPHDDGQVPAGDRCRSWRAGGGRQ